MKKSDVQLLLMVFGILVAFASWYFIYNANLTKIDEVHAESDALQVEINKLEALDAQKEQFLADTETMKQECDVITSYFPAGLLQEDEIMYMNNMERATMNQIVVPGISLGLPVEVPYAGNTSVDEYTLTDEGIQMYTSQTNISFTTTYTGFKNTLGYIYQMPGRKSVSAINLSASADGYLTGSMNVDFYYLTGTPLLYTPADIPAVPLGKDNIFGVLDENADAQQEEQEEQEE